MTTMLTCDLLMITFYPSSPPIPHNHRLGSTNQLSNYEGGSVVSTIENYAKMFHLSPGIPISYSLSRVRMVASQRITPNNNLKLLAKICGSRLLIDKISSILWMDILVFLITLLLTFISFICEVRFPNSNLSSQYLFY